MKQKEYFLFPRGLGHCESLRNNVGDKIYSGSSVYEVTRKDQTGVYGIKLTKKVQKN